MPYHTVKLLATIGACSALAFTLPAGAAAEELNTPHIAVPRVNVPKPHITVPTVNNNVSTVNTGSTVNLRHHRLSTHTNTFKNKLGNSQGNTTTTTAKTPFVGPTDTGGSNGTSNAGGSAGVKVITTTVGGSGTPSGVQQQNTGAAAAAAAIGAASSGTGASGGPNIPPTTTLPGSVFTNRNGASDVGTVNTSPVGTTPLTPPYGSAAYYDWLTGGGENAAYTADIDALEAAVTAADLDGGTSTPAARAATTAVQNFQGYIGYLLWLLALTQESTTTGLSWTPQETADVEAALQACLASPSTCAQTIANLNTELESLGVPTTFKEKNAGSDSTQILYTPSETSGFGRPFTFTTSLTKALAVIYQSF